ncbi:MAG: helix-turn-helix transcriptional regulator [Lachnospiraceae bacterium]|nr:helix-turn-helix transcriptional regulator [Lachnospiraceae bacterium]
MTFGEKIQKLRKEAGLSQEELAYQLEVSRQAISKYLWTIFSTGTGT